MECVKRGWTVVEKTLAFSRAYGSNGYQNLAYVAGWLGHDNLGDEALYAAARRIFPGAELLAFDGGRTVSYLSRVLPVFCAGLLAGGTLINATPAILYSALRCRKSVPEFFVFGTGVANADFWRQVPGWKDFTHRWAELLNSCMYVGVRGPISAEFLSDAGVKNVEVIGDPVLVFARDSVATTYEEGSLGLNIGHSYGRLWGSEEEICSEASKLALNAKRAGWSVKWFVIWPEDLEITRRAAAMSSTSEHILQIYHDANEFMEHAENLSVFVGLKLHATVLATCAMVPSVMLEYRQKCRDYMRSIGKEDLMVRTDRFRHEKVWDMVNSLAHDRLRESNDLLSAIKSLREKQRTRAQAIMKYLSIKCGAVLASKLMTVCELFGDGLLLSTGIV